MNKSSKSKAKSKGKVKDPRSAKQAGRKIDDTPAEFIDINSQNKRA